MRYAPKDGMYCQSMALTSQINVAIGINFVGHAIFSERLFKTMGFKRTALTFSGLRRMWRRVVKVKLRQRLAATTKMSEGVEKLKLDSEEGRCYSSGIRLEEGDNAGELPARKKTKANNPRTGSLKECKCGSRDHQRVACQKL
jgi:hypothetical protein